MKLLPDFGGHHHYTTTRRTSVVPSAVKHGKTMEYISVENHETFLIVLQRSLCCFHVSTQHVDMENGSGFSFILNLQYLKYVHVIFRHLQKNASQF